MTKFQRYKHGYRGIDTGAEVQARLQSRVQGYGSWNTVAGERINLQEKEYSYEHGSKLRTRLRG